MRYVPIRSKSMLARHMQNGAKFEINSIDNVHLCAGGTWNSDRADTYDTMSGGWIPSDNPSGSLCSGRLLVRAVYAEKL